MKATNILLGELTRSKNNNICSEDKNLHLSSSLSDDDDGDDDELNDLVMSEPTNSKSSIVGQFVGSVIVQCESFLVHFFLTNLLIGLVAKANLEWIFTRMNGHTLFLLFHQVKDFFASRCLLKV